MSNLTRSRFARFVSFVLLAALVVSGLKVSEVAHAATQLTWTGAHPPTTLSSAGNWSGNVAPVAGDDLFFPADAKRRSIRNNFPNQTSFNSFSFSGSNYNLRKNSVSLAAGINTSNASGSNTLSLPIQISADQTFNSANSGTTLTFNGPLNLNSNLLTVAGAGNTRFVAAVSGAGGITKNGSGTLTLSANNSYSGSTNVVAGTLVVSGSQPNSSVALSGGTLSGNGRVGAINATGGVIEPGTSAATGILNTGNVVLDPSTSLVIDLNSTTAGSGYRQLNVNGSLNLGGSVLDASANFQSPIGTTFTIVNNDGNDVVVGTFAGLAEGANLTLGGLAFTISYQGGTGNDVVLTRVSSPAPPPPTISIDDVSIGEGNSGTTDAIFTLTLSAPSDQTVTVDYSTADETATSPDDYALMSGTLAFNPGETTKTITVPVSGETLNEDDETFLLNLRKSVNAGLADPDGRGTILNDDAEPTISIGDASTVEGNSGTVDVALPVTLSVASGKTVTVDFATADGTATEHPGNDYDGLTGVITFAPGETDDEVDVTVHGDTDVESDETFFANLTNPTNSTVADAQGQGTIVDDDSVAPTPTPTPTPDPSPSPSPDPSPSPSPTPTPDPSPSPTPTPTPSPSPSPTPTPTPNPSPSPTATPTPNPSPSPTPTPTPSPSPSPSPTPGNTVQFSAANYNVAEGAGSIIITVNRSGDVSNAASVQYGTFDGTASERTDFTTAVGTLRFAAGQTSKSFVVFITDDNYLEGNEVFTVGLSNPQGVSNGSQSTASVTITDNDFAPSILNPADEAAFFVRQHYVDFLNREPDPSGLNFWTNEITSCGSAANCLNIKRVNVSAAYFLSTEFQHTGYMVYLLQKASFGNAPRYRAFVGNTQEISRGVIIGAPGAEELLEANISAFIEAWVNSPEFKTVYDGMNDTQFVDALFSNAGISNPADRNSLKAALQEGTATRASVLRALVEDPAFQTKEFNSAFVLMQYFGYLRRDPDAAPDNNLDGYNFWLTKLNNFNGNFVNADMVKAFITSLEYRERFGQN
ncbi:MAG TPA: Calx-beta domain-containing protein [Pyrinomonadaceae bacterium]|nr:Calx-beta domain-containing protein [Pyrinomonadaceae bacterium]